MVALRITGPGGIMPRLARRALPDHFAQEAQNITVSGGEWRPLRKAKQTWAPSSVVDPLLSVARLDDDTWLGWTTANVRVERAPLEGEARFIISGDGCPKITTVANATPVSATGGPASVRALGLPTPAAACSVSHSGGTGAATTRAYRYTWYSTGWNEESGASTPTAVTTGKVDGTWAVTSMVDTPPNSGSITAISKTATQITVTTSANHHNRAGDQVTLASIAGMTDANGLRTIAAVPAVNKMTFDLVTAQTYTSGGTWTRVVSWGACTKRLYRTVGSTGAWQLVAAGLTGTTYNDTLTDAAIPGDDLISEDWSPPPATLTGIVALPGGMLWGFTEGDRVLRGCEPFQPHAWPDRYKITLPDDIVGIAAWDEHIGVATQGMPVIVSGTDPSSMSQIRHQKPLPCVSRGSVCATGRGVVYASRNGLALLDLGGVEVFTVPLFLPEQWAAMPPETMQVAYDGARLYLSAETNWRVYVLDMVNNDALTSAYQRVHGMYADKRSGALFYVLNGNVLEFDALDTAPQSFDWWSKEYVLPMPSNWGAAKVETDARYSAEAIVLLQAEIADVTAANQAIMAQTLGGRGALAHKAVNVLEVNGSILAPQPVAETFTTFSLYIGDRVVFSSAVPSDKAFRLPGGYRADAFSIRLQSNTVVRAVVLADTMGALRAA